MKIHPHGYWLNDKSPLFDAGVAEELAVLFQGRTVLDLGCGYRGKYVRFLRKRGIECNGIDGNPLTLEPCQIADLALPISQTVHDCVLSLEVGEHIPAEHEGIFLDNVASHAQETVVMSWAIPGQSGYGHVNCQPNARITNQMEARGFRHDKAATQSFRDKANLHWFPNTLMVYQRNE